MTSSVRNRLLLLGLLWGLTLGVVAALLLMAMAEDYRLTGFLVSALVGAALSGAIGTLTAGRWAGRTIKRPRSGRRQRLLAGVGTGAFQGLMGGAVAALLFWALMAVTISGFTLRNPVEVSVLMNPRVFLGSFFVALSAFLYAFVVGGLLLGPVFGTLVNRIVRAGNVARKNTGDDTGGEEDLVVH